MSCKLLRPYLKDKKFKQLYEKVKSKLEEYYA